MSPIAAALANASARAYGFGAARGAAGAFESIATATGTGSSGTITFSSIPQTYVSLQLRCLMKNTQTATVGQDGLQITLNGDSGSNYWYRYVVASGSSISAGATSGLVNNLNVLQAVTRSTSGQENMMGVAIVDIHDYTSTSRNKTVRTFNASELNSSDGRICLQSGLWSATPAAITSITLTSGAGNFTTSTVVALYGIKGA